MSFQQQQPQPSSPEPYGSASSGGRQLRSDALFQGRSRSPVLELEHNVLSLRSSLPNSLPSPRNSSRHRQRASASFKDAVPPVSMNILVLNILRSWACRYL